MDFFARQAASRRRSRWMVFLFIVAVLAIVVAIDFVVVTTVAVLSVNDEGGLLASQDLSLSRYPLVILFSTLFVLGTIGISSLAGVAQRALDTLGVTRALVCLDAHMGEVYFGAFEAERGLVRACGPEQIAPPASVVAPEWERWTALGAGFSVHADALAGVTRHAETVVADVAARARDLLQLADRELAEGRAIAAAGARPTYLRDDSAWRRADRD